MDNEMLDEIWDEILEALPNSALEKLKNLPESKISQSTIYRIIEEGGVDVKEIIERKRQLNGKIE